MSSIKNDNDCDLYSGQNIIVGYFLKNTRNDNFLLVASSLSINKPRE